MTYPEFFIAPMRQELTSLGVRELRTAADVDAVLGRQLNQPGDQQAPTVMVIVNSVCGCAAGKARPGVALALGHHTRPDIVSTVFAGADIDATERARSYFTGYPPSSPSIALLRDGRLLWMLERRNIENQSAEMIAKNLTDAFDRYCAPATVKR
jgi:putative YphP/YqiW family bacilliredoxin